jgi:hypothetical protein
MGKNDHTYTVKPAANQPATKQKELHISGPMPSQPIPSVSFQALTLVEADIGKAVVAVDFKGCASQSKRKPVYIAEEGGKLIVSSCSNTVFKNFKNALLTFYVKDDKIEDFKKTLKKVSLIKLPTANLVTRLNPILAALQANSHLENFVRYSDYEAAKYAYNEKTGNLKVQGNNGFKTPQPVRRSLIGEPGTLKRHMSETSLAHMNGADISRKSVNFNTDQAVLANLLDRLNKFKGFKAIDLLIKEVKEFNGEESLLSLTQQVDFLIKIITDEKKAAIEALQKLKNWLSGQEQTELKGQIGLISSKLGPAIKRLNEKFDSESFSFEEFVGACRELKSIAGILKSYFNQKTHNLELNPNYKACKAEVLKGIEDIFSGITKKDGGFGAILEIVNTILTQDSFINQFTAYNLQFNKKINELTICKNDSAETLATLISAEDSRVQERVLKTHGALDAWESTLESFKPISESGVLQNPDLFDQVIIGYKTLFQESLEKLGILDKSSLEEKKGVLVNQLDKFKDQINACEVNIALASDKASLLRSVDDLLAASDAISDKEGLQNFEKQAAQLTERFDLLKQGLTERDALQKLYEKNVATCLKAISKKSSKLEAEGKGVAIVKAGKLTSISQQVSQLKDKLGSTDKRDLTSEIKSVKKHINDNYGEIKEYRSNYFSGFFFGKLLGINLENRVESKRLVDALKTQLEDLEICVEKLSR